MTDPTRLDPLDWFAAAAALGEDAACWLEPATRTVVRRRRRGASIDTRRARTGSARPRRHGQRCWPTVSRGGPAADSPVPARSCWVAPRFAERRLGRCLLGGVRDRPAGRAGDPARRSVDGAAVLTCSLAGRDDRSTRRPARRRAARPGRAGSLPRPRHERRGRPALRRSCSTRSAGIRTERHGPRRSPVRREPLAGDASTRWCWPGGSTSAHPLPSTSAAVLGASRAPTTPPSGAPVTVFAFSRGGRTFLGASPERLVAASGRSFRTIALAGTTGRSPTPRSTPASARRSWHPRRIARSTRWWSRCCARRCRHWPLGCDIDRTPHVVRLPTLQHLATDISGDLHDDLGILDLVDRLHPTPAVGGWPRAAALELLEEQEHLDRGWYAGPVGWVDARGDGEFVVAIRSGVIAGDQAHLFVGCGIVADSEPDREWAESIDEAREPRVGARPAGPMTRLRHDPAAPLRAFVAELVAAGVREAIVCPGSTIDAPGAGAAGAPEPARAGPPRRARGGLPGTRAGQGRPSAGRHPGHVGDGGRELRTCGGGGVPRPCAAHRADRRPAARAARPRRRPDHRPGATVRSRLQVVRGAAGPGGWRGR